MRVNWSIRSLLMPLALLSVSGMARAEQSCDAILAENQLFCVAPSMAPDALDGNESPAQQKARWAREEQERKDRERCCCPPSCEPRKPVKKTPVPGTIRACPPMPKGPATMALIAANYDSRASFTYRGTPDTPVRVLLDTRATRDMDFTVAVPDMQRRSPHLSADYQRAEAGRPFITRTDKNGEVKLVLKLRLPQNQTLLKPLDKPVDVQVLFREEESKTDVVATVRIGLGIKLIRDRLTPVATDLAQQPHHVWRGIIESRFHPGMDLKDYLEGLVACDPMLPRPIVNIQSVAINFTERNTDTPLLDGIGGLDEDTAPNALARLKMGVKFTIGRDPVRSNYLRPLSMRRDEPIFRIKDDIYPAVTQKIAGKFAKSYFGFLRVQEPSEYREGPEDSYVYSQDSLEPRVMASTPVIFSMQDTERWYISALCATEARTADQMLFLQALTLIPSVGEGVELTLGSIGALCDISKGQYQAAFTRLGYTLGKVGLGKLVKDGLIPKATEGSWSPKFYRALGIDPASMSARERKALGDALGTAYELAVSTLEKSQWTPPK